MVDTALDDLPGRNLAGPADEERHTQRDFVHVEWAGAVAFAPKALVTEGAAVIRGVDDEGVVQLAAGVEAVEDAPHLVVDLADGGVVAPVAAADFVFGGVGTAHHAFVFVPGVWAVGRDVAEGGVGVAGDEGGIVCLFFVG